MKRLGLLAAAVSVSCASADYRDFYINTLNTEEQAIPAVIYLDDELVVDASNQPVRTPATVKVKFESDGGSYRRVKMNVKGVVIDPEGKITFGLREGEASPFIEEPRAVDRTDVKTQTFVLRRNKEFGI